MKWDIDSLKLEIDKVEIVSFDVFDTLLLRNYVNPTDLFLHVEKKEDAKGFYLERVDAEKRCRRKYKNKEDITIDDIYNEIDGGFKHLKDCELEFEKKSLHPNFQIKSLYDYALEKGKKIIAVSDMYLPESFLKNVLLCNGFSVFDGVFVSGELDKTKAKGTVFKYVLEKYSIAASRLLHIGDNEHSDYKVPKELGINSRLYPKISRQYFGKFRYLREFYRANKGSLEVSVVVNLVGEYMLNGSDKNYWIELGFRLAGPVSYAFSHFINNEIRKRKITKLLFIARDGYLLRKIWNLFGVKVDNYYVYAPRLLSLLFASKSKDERYLKSLLNFYRKYVPAAYGILKRANPKSLNDYNDMLQNDRSLLRALEDGRRNYRNYLSSLFTPGEDDRIGIVDATTYNLSAQYLLNTALKSNCFGIYCMNDGPCKQGYIQFFPKPGYGAARKFRYELIEFLFSSPEMPVKFVHGDGTVVYDDHPHKEELRRSEIYNYIAAGAHRFVSSLINAFGRDLLEIDAQVLIKYLNLFTRYPSAEDFKNMSEIYHAPGWEHNVYLPFMSANLKWLDYFVHPWKTHRFLRNCVWRRWIQSLFVHALRPCSVKIRHGIHIYIFPYLAFFRLNLLSLGTSRFKFTFTIGRLPWEPTSNQTKNLHGQIRV